LGGSSFAGVHQAMANGTKNDWTLVQIKVCNHIYTPLMFALGKLDNTTGRVSYAAGIKTPSSNMSATSAQIRNDVESISNIPRFAKLRLNKWFASILLHGSENGVDLSTISSSFEKERLLKGLKHDDVKRLGDDVAVQGFVGLAQIGTNNHSLKGCKLRVNMEDLTLFAHKHKLIESPLGLTAFMMGNAYDKAEGALERNAILGDGVGEKLVVDSRTVGEYAAQIKQFVGQTYSDRDSVEQNLTYRFDRLVVKDPQTRREMIASLQQFRASADSLRDAADLELKVNSYVPDQANGQSGNGNNKNSVSEFLAQCKFVAKALDMGITGQPLRNFSLFLNVVDLDGRALTETINQTEISSQIRALTYVEGMRQLAMGLNVLGKKISEGKKVIVVVTSEGGRSSALADSNLSSGLVMGPSGPGMLADALYADMTAIQSENSSIVTDPGNRSAGGNWTQTDAFKDVNGLDMPKDIAPTTGDVQMGVVDFLENQTGISVRKSLGVDGSYVKLKRT
jgi:hypothetical protein